MINTKLHLYEAFLFDLDGTLADSMTLHNQAWISTLADLGCVMTQDILREFAGVPNEKSVEIFNKRFGWSLDPITVATEKEIRFLKTIHQVKPIEQVVKIARENFRLKPMAIVSGGTKEIVDSILAAVQLEEFFSVRVCASEDLRPKPHPDPFLKAAKLLKVQPEKCLVFEDGMAGIQGAKAAGMAVIKVEVDFKMNFLS